MLNLKLADPATAPAFAAKRTPSHPPPGASGSTPPPPFLQSWQDIRESSANLVKNQRRALITGAWLLALLAVASLAVLVGGRMADQIRRVGLLKAVGGTPGLVAAVLLAEYVVVALARGGGRAGARIADRSLAHRRERRPPRQRRRAHGRAVDGRRS